MSSLVDVAKVEMLAEPMVQPTPFASWAARPTAHDRKLHSTGCRKFEAVHDVRCGRFVTAVLTAEGSLYAWGCRAAPKSDRPS